MSGVQIYKLSADDQKILTKVSKIYNYEGDGLPIKCRDIEYVVDKLGRPLPDDYLQFMGKNKTVEIEVHYDSDFEYIAIYDVLDSKSRMDDIGLYDTIPNAVPIGDNGGSELIIYATGNSGFGLYLVDFSVISIDEAIYIGESFTHLFSKDECLRIVFQF